MNHINNILQHLLLGFTKFITGVRVQGAFSESTQEQYIIFSNHSSHLDLLVILSALPKKVRKNTLAVASKEYWLKNKIKTYISSNVLKTLFIHRKWREHNEANPIEILDHSVKTGNSLIIFPEGTRSLTGKINPFKKGIFLLAKKNPHLKFIPVYTKNLYRILPKGEFLPIPATTSINFGTPITLGKNEDCENFLARAHKALEVLK